MLKKNLPLMIAVIGAAAVTSTACLQFFIAEPKQQLPADIFKLHVHVEAEPLTLEVPLLGGTTTLKSPKPAADPQAQFTAIITEYEADPKRHRSFAEHNDYAVSLVFSGRLKEAITALNQLEQDHPGEYATASNLGTAYELIGDVENAVAWIQKVF